MSSKIPFEKVKIDSFSLLIPFEDVTIIDDYFNQKYIKVYSGGLVESQTSQDEIQDKEFYNRQFHSTNNGIKSSIKVISRLWNGENKNFIHIVITSKFLKEQCFEGINKANVDLIHKYIEDLKIIKVTKATLLTSFVTDIDFCIDLSQPKELYDKQNKYLKGLVLNSLKGYLKRFNNANIQLNERPKATPAKPFVKVYFKTDLLFQEAIENEDSFYASYLTEYASEIKKGISRFEVTLKNYKHKEKLKLKHVKTLNDLLNLDQSELKEVHENIFKSYFEPKKMRINKSKLTPTDKMLVHTFNKLVELDNNFTETEILNLFIHEFEGAQKVRIKQKTRDLLEFISNKKQLEINETDFDKKQILDNLKLLGVFE